MKEVSNHRDTRIKEAKVYTLWSTGNCDLETVGEAADSLPSGNSFHMEGTSFRHNMPDSIGGDI